MGAENLKPRWQFVAWPKMGQPGVPQWADFSDSRQAQPPEGWFSPQRHALHQSQRCVTSEAQAATVLLTALREGAGEGEGTSSRENVSSSNNSNYISNAKRSHCGSSFDEIGPLTENGASGRTWPPTEHGAKHGP